MKTFCFTVDDNIRFLKEITLRKYGSLFEHPYLAMYRRLHDAFGLKVQLNLFYEADGFTLAQMSDAYYREWQENADWLKLSFHSHHENESPYEFSGYDEVYRDCQRVNDEIVRFASASALASTTTVHYCLTTVGGRRALADQGVQGLLGLFGDVQNPRTSYGIAAENAETIRNGELFREGDICFASIDIVLNCFSKESILSQLAALQARDSVRVMIHEQYYYADYAHYQSDFEEKLRATFSFLCEHGYESCLFEQLIG